MDTEGHNDLYAGSDCWPLDKALAAMLDNQSGAIEAVRRALGAIEQAVLAAAGRLSGENGRLMLAGAGASGRIAVQDGVELWPTFGWPHERLAFLVAGGNEALVRSIEGAEDDSAAARREMARLGPCQDDVLVAVAASGTTRYTIEAQRVAREAGALTVALACNPGSPLLVEAEVPILLHTGAEFLAGSTRMAAGTAQKVALNLFSTQLMTRLGRVYDGYMVRVVATNAKLRERAVRIAAAISGKSEEASAHAMELAGFDIPTAVLILDGDSLDHARERMAAAQGNLRKARQDKGLS